MRRLGWFLFFLFLAYFIFLIRQDIIDNLDLRKEKEKLVKRIEEAESLFRQMKKRLSLLEKGELVEELARTRLGLIKNGETAYKIVD